MAVIPLGIVNFALDKQSCLQIAAQLQEEGQKLVIPSRLEVASNMGVAEKMAAFAEGVKADG